MKKFLKQENEGKKTTMATAKKRKIKKIFKKKAKKEKKERKQRNDNQTDFEERKSKMGEKTGKKKAATSSVPNGPKHNNQPNVPFFCLFFFSLPSDGRKRCVMWGGKVRFFMEACGDGGKRSHRHRRRRREVFVLWLFAVVQHFSIKSRGGTLTIQK